MSKGEHFVLVMELLLKELLDEGACYEKEAADIGEFKARLAKIVEEHELDVDADGLDAAFKMLEEEERIVFVYGPGLTTPTEPDKLYLSREGSKEAREIAERWGSGSQAEGVMF